jgi:hypothetical protein
MAAGDGPLFARRRRSAGTHIAAGRGSLGLSVRRERGRKLRWKQRRRRRQQQQHNGHKSNLQTIAERSSALRPRCCCRRCCCCRCFAIGRLRTNTAAVASEDSFREISVCERADRAPTSGQQVSGLVRPGLSRPQAGRAQRGTPAIVVHCSLPLPGLRSLSATEPTGDEAGI